MKRAILFIAAFLITGIASAQKTDKKRFTTGFEVGLNRANYILNDISSGENIENGLGFRAGLTSSIAMSKRFSLDPKASISFNTSSYNDGTQQFAVNPSEVEFMTHLKMNLREGAISPYILVGPNIKVPVSRSNEFTLLTQQHLALDLGIGLDLPLPGGIRITHELRYSIGLMNLAGTTAPENMKFHNISLIVGFSGRPRL